MSNTKTIAEQIGLGDKYKKKDKKEDKKKQEQGILKYFKKKITEAMS